MFSIMDTLKAFEDLKNKQRKCMKINNLVYIA